MINQPIATIPSCPVCGKNQSEKLKPFCSARCAQVDLHRWMGGAYAVPDTSPLTDDAEGPATLPNSTRGDEN
ncbi:MAG: DNA gyrase inhibitor YacG [Alphaproteobacteria bacterium]|nr:DNA gyrase inhibitor YacG [Alphaproteobacteria bacterium]